MFPEIRGWFGRQGNLQNTGFFGFMFHILFPDFEDLYNALFYKKSSYLARYGVASVSRIDKIIGLFCRILSLL